MLTSHSLPGAGGSFLTIAFAETGVNLEDCCICAGSAYQEEAWGLGVLRKAARQASRHSIAFPKEGHSVPESLSHPRQLHSLSREGDDQNPSFSCPGTGPFPQNFQIQLKLAFSNEKKFCVEVPRSREERPAQPQLLKGEAPGRGE